MINYATLNYCVNSVFSQIIHDLSYIQNKKKKKAESFIPYRDSVLTWLLRENLGTCHLYQWLRPV